MEKRVQRSLVKERIFVKGPSVCRGVGLAVIHTDVASCMNVMGGTTGISGEFSVALPMSVPIRVSSAGARLGQP